MAEESTPDPDDPETRNVQFDRQLSPNRHPAYAKIASVVPSSGFRSRVDMPWPPFDDTHETLQYLLKPRVAGGRKDGRGQTERMPLNPQCLYDMPMIEVVTNLLDDARPFRYSNLGITPFTNLEWHPLYGHQTFDDFDKHLSRLLVAASVGWVSSNRLGEMVGQHGVERADPVLVAARQLGGLAFDPAPPRYNGRNHFQPYTLTAAYDGGRSDRDRPTVGRWGTVTEAIVRRLWLYSKGGHVAFTPVAQPHTRLYDTLNAVRDQAFGTQQPVGCLSSDVLANWPRNQGRTPHAVSVYDVSVFNHRCPLLYEVLVTVDADLFGRYTRHGISGGGENRWWYAGSRDLEYDGCHRPMYGFAYYAPPRHGPVLTKLWRESEEFRAFFHPDIERPAALPIVDFIQDHNGQPEDYEMFLVPGFAQIFRWLANDYRM